MKHYEINVIPPVNSVDAIDGFGLVLKTAVEKWLPDEMNGCELRGLSILSNIFNLYNGRAWMTRPEI